MKKIIKKVIKFVLLSILEWMKNRWDDYKVHFNKYGY